MDMSFTLNLDTAGAFALAVAILGASIVRTYVSRMAS